VGLAPKAQLVGLVTNLLALQLVVWRWGRSMDPQRIVWRWDLSQFAEVDPDEAAYIREVAHVASLSRHAAASV